MRNGSHGAVGTALRPSRRHVRSIALLSSSSAAARSSICGATTATRFRPESGPPAVSESARIPVVLTRLAVGMVWLLHFLPLPVFARIGSGLGGFLYFLARERRKVCLINLARCFPQMPERERVAIAKAHFRAFGRTVLERSILWWAPREQITRMVRVV